MKPSSLEGPTTLGSAITAATGCLTCLWQTFLHMHRQSHFVLLNLEAIKDGCVKSNFRTRRSSFDIRPQCQVLQNPQPINFTEKIK